MDASPATPQNLVYSPTEGTMVPLNLQSAFDSVATPEVTPMDVSVFTVHGTYLPMSQLHDITHNSMHHNSWAATNWHALAFPDSQHHFSQHGFVQSVAHNLHNLIEIVYGPHIPTAPFYLVSIELISNVVLAFEASQGSQSFLILSNNGQHIPLTDGLFFLIPDIYETFVSIHAQTQNLANDVPGPVLQHVVQAHDIILQMGVHILTHLHDMASHSLAQQGVEFVATSLNNQYVANAIMDTEPSSSDDTDSPDNFEDVPLESDSADSFHTPDIQHPPRPLVSPISSTPGSQNHQELHIQGGHIQDGSANSKDALPFSSST